jgi:hypothetical protein
MYHTMFAYYMGFILHYNSFKSCFTVDIDAIHIADEIIREEVLGHNGILELRRSLLFSIHLPPLHAPYTATCHLHTLVYLTLNVHNRSNRHIDRTHIN